MIAEVLGRISASFGRPIRALDVGCGTDRHFHCLRGVQRLVGIDLSPGMLQLARSPIRHEQVEIEEIELICDNVLAVEFPEGSFDFICSLGMFGHGIPVTPELCDRFHRWLSPGGKLFFDAIDRAGLPLLRRFRHRLGLAIRNLAPSLLRRPLSDPGIPFYPLSDAELESVMRRTAFATFSVSSRECESPLWRGRHLECLAGKGPGSFQQAVGVEGEALVREGAEQAVPQRPLPVRDLPAGQGDRVR